MITMSPMLVSIGIKLVPMTAQGFEWRVCYLKVFNAGDARIPGDAGCSAATPAGCSCSTKAREPCQWKAIMQLRAHRGSQTMSDHQEWRPTSWSSVSSLTLLSSSDDEPCAAPFPVAPLGIASWVGCDSGIDSIASGPPSSAYDRFRVDIRH